MPPSATLALLLAAGGAALRLGAASDPTAACAAKLDAWCGNESNPALSVCYKSMRATKVKIPLVAAYSGQSGAPTERKWRCYSPTDLKTDPSTTPVMQRSWTAGPDYCSDSVPLEALLRECDPSWTPPPPPPCPPSQRCPSMVFAGGAIPSLVFVPAAAAAAESAEGNGTLIAFSEYAAKCPGDPTATCSLGAKRSTDGGASWSAAAFPVDEATQLPSPGSHSNWCCPQSLWDPATKSVVLQFSNATSVKGGCDISEQQLGGVLQVRSTDAGKSWGDFQNIQTQLEFPKKPANCLAPTSGQGLVMRPVNGKYGGRLVFCAVRNAYEGDVPVWSDDNGKTYNYSTGLYLPGLDECNIAQAANGSLFLISRNCREGNLNKCQMMAAATDNDDDDDGDGHDDVSRTSSMDRMSGTGNHHFVYSVSNDGGETWTAPRDQEQMLTPVCMGSIISHQGGSDTAPALYYSSPYSATARVNLTILASDDNGATFSRSLMLWPGAAGYTGLACGLAGKDDCAVLYSGTGGLNFLRFASSEVK